MVHIQSAIKPWVLGIFLQKHMHTMLYYIWSRRISKSCCNILCFQRVKIRGGCNNESQITAEPQELHKPCHHWTYINIIETSNFLSVKVRLETPCLFFKLLVKLPVSVKCCLETPRTWNTSSTLKGAPEITTTMTILFNCTYDYW